MSEPGELVTIPGLGVRRRIAAKYDHAGARCRCPRCGGVGFVWRGWFACDGPPICRCVALVETGEAFEPLEEPPR